MPKFGVVTPKFVKVPSNHSLVFIISSHIHICHKLSNPKISLSCLGDIWGFESPKDTILKLSLKRLITTKLNKGAHPGDYGQTQPTTAKHI